MADTCLKPRCAHSVCIILRALGLKSSTADPTDSATRRDHGFTIKREAPFRFEHNTVLLAISATGRFEPELGASGKHWITRFGCAKLDTGDLEGLPPGEDGREWADEAPPYDYDIVGRQDGLPHAYKADYEITIVELSKWLRTGEEPGTDEHGISFYSGMIGLELERDVQQMQRTVKVMSITELYNEMQAAHYLLTTPLDDLLEEMKLPELYLAKHRAGRVLRTALAISIRATQASAPAFGRSRMRTAAANAWRRLSDTVSGTILGFTSLPAQGRNALEVLPEGTHVETAMSGGSVSKTKATPNHGYDAVASPQPPTSRTGDANTGRPIVADSVKAEADHSTATSTASSPDAVGSTCAPVVPAPPVPTTAQPGSPLQRNPQERTNTAVTSKAATAPQSPAITPSSSSVTKTAVFTPRLVPASTEKHLTSIAAVSRQKPLPSEGDVHCPTASSTALLASSDVPSDRTAKASSANVVGLSTALKSLATAGTVVPSLRASKDGSPAPPLVSMRPGVAATSIPRIESLSPRFYKPSPVPAGYDDSTFTPEDKRTVIRGRASVERLPTRIAKRVEVYTEMTSIISTWLVRAARELGYSKIKLAAITLQVETGSSKREHIPGDVECHKLLAAYVASHTQVHTTVPINIGYPIKLRTFVSDWYTNVQVEQPRMADAFLEETQRHRYFTKILEEVKTILEAATRGGDGAKRVI